MTAIRQSMPALARCERGATAIEYGLIVALIAVAAIGGMSSLGGGVGGKWGDISGKVTTAMG